MDDAHVRGYMTAIIARFSKGREQIEEAFELLDRIGGPEIDAIKLLALRRYLRMGGEKVQEQWAWSDSEAKVMMESPAAQALLAEARQVQKAFAAKNPGYSLALSPLRSLERQVKLWHNNPTVKRASKALMTDAQKELKKEAYAPLTGLSAAKFSTFLSSSRVTPEPSSAAPGTSDHGQMRAVDFVVMFGKTKVADTDTDSITTVWHAKGWKEKLAAATAGTRLKGPLPKPYEPWHWWLPT